MPASGNRNEDSGVIVIDKPPDISSAGVVRIVKRVLNAKKVGHAGTLDPFATGVLVCCVNKATRLADFFLKSEKTYRADMVLGVSTDTQDATGTVISKCDPGDVSVEEIRRTFKRFTGDIDQQPPTFSALKHKGVPLYKLARQGKPVRKPPRRVHIARLDILEMDLPHVCFEVTCSAGTYIRTLCADIGFQLGCGGHLKDLRRLKSGGFTIEDAVDLAELKALARTGNPAQRMIGMADALRDMPGCLAEPDLIKKITSGRPIRTGDLIPPPDMPTGFFKVVDANNRLIAVLDHKKGHLTYDYRCVFPN